MELVKRLLSPPYTEEEIQRQPLIDPNGQRFVMRQANIDHWQKWSRRFGFATLVSLGVFIGALAFLVVAHGN